MRLERIPYHDPVDQRDTQKSTMRNVGEAFVRLCDW